MKTVTPALAAYLAAIWASATDVPLYFCDLFTITLANGSVAGIANGTVLAITNLDVPVAWNGNVYLANSLLIDGLKYKSTTGFDADQQQVQISATTAMQSGGIPTLGALQQGLFDGAEIQRERAFFSSFAGQTPLTPIGTILLFKGRVGEAQVGRTTAKVTVSSDLVLLSIDMPRRLYQTSCIHTLYDAGCTLNRASHTASGSVTSASTTATINWASATSVYQQGAVTFTSGANEGITATVKTSTSGSFSLAYPLPYAPAVGDTFSISQGCDHTLATCTSQFANQVNFLGFPFVPPPGVVTGALESTAAQGKG